MFTKITLFEVRFKEKNMGTLNGTEALHWPGSMCNGRCDHQKSSRSPHPCLQTCRRLKAKWSGIILGIIFSVLFFLHLLFCPFSQHFGAGSCHFNGIATLWSSNLSFSMIFATFWCSNFSCWIVFCVGSFWGLYIWDILGLFRIF